MPARVRARQGWRRPNDHRRGARDRRGRCRQRDPGRGGRQPGEPALAVRPRRGRAAGHGDAASRSPPRTVDRPGAGARGVPRHAPAAQGARPKARRRPRLLPAGLGGARAPRARHHGKALVPGAAARRPRRPVRRGHRRHAGHRPRPRHAARAVDLRGHRQHRAAAPPDVDRRPRPHRPAQDGRRRRGSGRGARHQRGHRPDRGPQAAPHRTVHRRRQRRSPPSGRGRRPARAAACAQPRLRRVGRSRARGWTGPWRRRRQA